MGIFMGISAQDEVGHTGCNPGVTALMSFDINFNIGKFLLIYTERSKAGIKELIESRKTLESFKTKL